MKKMHESMQQEDKNKEILINVVTNIVDYNIGMDVVEKTSEEIVCKEHVIDSMPKENGQNIFTVEEYMLKLWDEGVCVEKSSSRE